jgi:hypothetical protein
MAAEGDLRGHLGVLTDPHSGQESFAEAMTQVGAGLGRWLASRQDLKGKTVVVVARAQVMDTLASGFIGALSDGDADVRVACLWIHRSVIQRPEPVEVSQIIQEYVDEIPPRIDHLVVLDATISSVSALAASIMRMAREAFPSTVHVVSPVALSGVKRALASRLPLGSVGRLKGWALAVDVFTDEAGNVFPGLGGNPYERLGFAEQGKGSLRMPRSIVRRIRDQRSDPASRPQI